MAQKKAGRPRKKTLEEQVITRSLSIDNESWLDTLPDPDRVLEKLNLDADTAYKDLMADEELTAVMGTRLSSLKGMNWGVVANKSEDRVLKATEEMLEGLNRNHQGQGISRMIDDILSANAWGMSCLEVVWDTTNQSLWVPKTAKGRPYRYFTFDKNNNLRFLSKENSIYGEEIPDYKIILSRHYITSQSYDNPYGDKLLSKCYWPISFKRNGIQWWNVFIEKYGMPWVWGKVQPNVDSTVRSNLADDLQNMVQDGVIITSNDESIELVSPDNNNSSSSNNFNELLTYMNKAIQKVWLGQTLTTDVGDVGSYAASKTHQGVKDERKRQDQKMVESAIQTLIDWFVELNFGKETESPNFEMSDPIGINTEIAERDSKLSKVSFTKEYYMKTYGFSEEDFEVVDNSNSNNDGFSRSFANSPSFPDQVSIDNMIDNLDPTELQKQANGVLKPIIDLINNAEDYNEVLKTLLSAWPNMDSSEAEKMIERATFVSETLGRLNG